MFTADVLFIRISWRSFLILYLGSSASDMSCPGRFIKVCSLTLSMCSRTIGLLFIYSYFCCVFIRASNHPCIFDKIWSTRICSWCRFSSGSSILSPKPLNLSWSSAACSKIRWAFGVYGKSIFPHNYRITSIIFLVSLFSTEVGFINQRWAYTASWAWYSFWRRSSVALKIVTVGGRISWVSWERFSISSTATDVISSIIAWCLLSITMIETPVSVPTW